MSNATEENCQVQTDTHAAPPTGECPSWCVSAVPGRPCDGDHFAVDAGTLATGGRPPVYSGKFDSPRYDAVSVTPQYPQTDGLCPNVGLMMVVGDNDIAVELTPTEARRAAIALAAAADLVEDVSGAAWPIA